MRSLCFILAVTAAAGGGMVATAREAPAPDAGPFVPFRLATPPADGTAPPGPVAEPQATDNFSPSPGNGVPAPDPEPKKRKFPLEASWDNGLHLDDPDGQFHIHIGGVGQIDTVWMIGPKSVFTTPGGGANGVGNAEASQLRRAILEASGDIFDQF